ncbi:hypothetical protein ACFU5Y_24040 [Streptomyces gardneri]|uniref:hypothetical protein n=1 Tax=Streptomyces gardneri TaxID=66892 RepID=UPI0036B23A12
MPRTALIVIDMLDTYAHEDAEALVPSVREAHPGIATLLRNARAGDPPVIYVNDDFGEWRSHHGEIVSTALDGRHRDLVEPVVPDVVVAADAVAHIDAGLARAALRMMRTNMSATVCPADEIAIDARRPE